MRMAHRGTHGKLNKDHDCNSDRPGPQVTDGVQFCRCLDVRPESGSNERDHRCETEKALREASMKESQQSVVLGNTQTAKYSLNNHRNDGDPSQPPHPTPLLDHECDPPEDERQQAHTAGNKTMGMLKKDATHPARDREEKHAVSKAVRPVGNRQPGFVTRHQAATADQNENTAGNKGSKPVQEPIWKSRCSHRT